MQKFVDTVYGGTIPLPDYDAGCITNLPAFFQNTLLGDRPNVLSRRVQDKIRLEGVNNVVFFLVDGFGMKQWADYRDKFEALQLFERDGYCDTLDSVFPSSTPVALNALHTDGLTPAQHGLVDWWMYVGEIDKIIATLPFSEMGGEAMDSLQKYNVSPSVLLSNPTTFENFEEKGIKTRVFMYKDYTQSTYTKVAYNGSQIVPYGDVGELFSVLPEQIKEYHKKPTYNFVYWGGIDVAGHQYGLEGDEHKQAAKEFFSGLNEFLSKENLEGTLFVISADHGQVNVNPEETFYLDQIDGLYELFRTSEQGRPILPWGGAREVFLALREGTQERALSLLHEAIGDRVELLRSRDALAAGLFGRATNIHPHFLSRIGDVVILPKGNATIWYHHPEGEPFKLRGHHGGLSDGELKVPFCLLRPDRISAV